MDNRVSKAVSDWLGIDVSVVYETISSTITDYSTIATMITATLCVWFIAWVMQRYNVASVSLFKVINVVAKDDKPPPRAPRERRAQKGRARR